MKMNMSVGFLSFMLTLFNRQWHHPTEAGDNVLSAVITGLICRVREAAVEVQASPSHWALSGNTMGPLKSCWDNGKSSRNQSTTWAMDSGFLIFWCKLFVPTWTFKETAFFWLTVESYWSVTKDNMYRHKTLTHRHAESKGKKKAVIHKVFTQWQKKKKIQDFGRN